MARPYKNIFFKARALQLSLFYLLLSYHAAYSQFRHPINKAYSDVLNFEFDSARKNLGGIATGEKEALYRLYVLNLADALEVFLSDSEELYGIYADREEERLSQIQKLPDSIPEKLFLEAEVKIQWAFVKLQFGSYLKAFLNFRQAYFSTTENLKKFPGFIPSQKSMGVLHTVLGSFPDSYGWVLTLAGIRGDIQKGIAELDLVSYSDSSFAIETKIYKSIFQTFLLNQKSEALHDLNLIYDDYEFLTIDLLKALLMTKNSESKKAQAILRKMERNNTGDKVAFIFYLLGETYLQEHEYVKSISAYKEFLSKHKGRNYLKDTYTKIAVNHWLSNSEKYKIYLEKAENTGQTQIDADKNAAQLIESGELPHKTLLKIRYATDGGYYQIAEKIIENTTERDFEEEDDILEFHYRRARYYHKSGAIELAKPAYKNVIALQKEKELYFAPNSCLELGYILISENSEAEALGFFEQAKKYKNHPYKYSIDKKADIEKERILNKHNK